MTNQVSTAASRREAKFEANRPITTKAALWDARWAKINKTAKALIALSFNLKDHDKNKLKAPEKLLSIAKSNAVKAGFIALEVCSRCCGTGKFSWNSRTGSKCFGCHGHGKQIPSATAVLKAVKQAAKRGEKVSR